MIIIKELRWANWFSYGDGNVIKFDKVKLTQLEGTNGNGKSSIPLILEEVLYGKNSKGVKKQNLPNRYTDKTSTNATLFFDVDEDEYEIQLVRKSTINLKLFKNGNNISSHKSPDTYKHIESIIGTDFKTFCQLVYQSSTSSLQFLTATDTSRKRFLISLLSLEKYSEAHEYYKGLYKEQSKASASLNGSLNTIKSWIDTNSNLDLEHKEIKDEVKEPVDLVDEVNELKAELANINNTNNLINKNNQYKKSLKLLDLDLMSKKIEEPKPLKDLMKKETTIETTLSNKKRLKDKLNKLGNQCPTCYQNITEELKQNYLDMVNASIDKLTTELSEVSIFIQEQRGINQVYKKQQEIIKEFELLTNYIDDNIADDILDAKEITNKVKDLQNTINNINSDIRAVTEYNTKVVAHNAKVKVISSQLSEYQSDLNKTKLRLEASNGLNSKIDILKHSFSTNGIVGFKIESMIKGLEVEINNYLAELASGRFQLHFVLDSEKLNINIVDNGITVTIDALSAGELARVNVSTLLAIRKLMSAISSTKINLLFLDEVYSVLDLEGKNTLSEVLLKEDLNTFLVAHDYSHPLMDVIHVIKEDNMSRLEW